MSPRRARHPTGESDAAAEARQWLLSTTTATLSTIAAEAEVSGWPFGSLAPFALAGDGTPIVLLSEIAQHTKNLRRDPRLSLFVRQPSASGDPQAGWRVTVLGRARPLERHELEEAHARYCARVRSVDRAGFLLETTSPNALRYVGFGREIEASEARAVFTALAREARAEPSAPLFP